MQTPSTKSWQGRMICYFCPWGSGACFQLSLRVRLQAWHLLVVVHRNSMRACPHEDVASIMHNSSRVLDCDPVAQVWDLLVADRLRCLMFLAGEGVCQLKMMLTPNPNSALHFDLN